jgi:uncharacterized protein YeaO (DUF488 family)
MLKTKKMNAPPEESDGIRICIMRDKRVYHRHLKSFQEKYGIPMYHLHIKELGPTIELKNAYKNKEITFEEYIPIYFSDTIEKESDLIDEIAEKALTTNITALCTEPKPKNSNEILKCHRRLFAEECKRRQPTLEILIE